jgi:hypothetical protein
VLSDLWPVPYESIEVPTRFGPTHAVVSGPPAASPLLLHGAGLSATSWYPNIATYAAQFRTYALDTIFDAGRGRQTRPLRSRQDCAAWVGDVWMGWASTKRRSWACPKAVGNGVSRPALPRSPHPALPTHSHAASAGQHQP